MILNIQKLIVSKNVMSIILCSEKCPAGYEYQTGDVMGDGTVNCKTCKSNASLEECGETCLQNFDCNSFEHDAGRRQCNLNIELEPNSPKPNENFVFCKNNGNHV